MCQRGAAAKAFIRRCKLVAVSGVSLHSYRYAWAERARSCGYALDPRAQNNFASFAKLAALLRAHGVSGRVFQTVRKPRGKSSLPPLKKKHCYSGQIVEKKVFFGLSD